MFISHSIVCLEHPRYNESIINHSVASSLSEASITCTSHAETNIRSDIGRPVGTFESETNTCENNPARTSIIKDHFQHVYLSVYKKEK